MPAASLYVGITNENFIGMPNDVRYAVSMPVSAEF